VARAEEAQIELTQLSDADIAAVLAASEDADAAALAGDADVAARLRDAARLESALARPDVIGGTAPARVRTELTAAAARLGIDA
jgi:hypothetical protein